MPGMSIAANNAPCRYCERRHPGCHTICIDYKEYRKKQDEIAAKRQLQLQSEPGMSNHVKQFLWKQMKSRKRGHHG